jgi:hypothetical protein
LRTNGAEFDSYIGIADGAIHSPLESNLNEETSIPFTLSGISLEQAKINKHQSLIFCHNSSHELTASIALLQYISKDWTPAQAAPMLEMLKPMNSSSYTEIAKLLGKSRQSITKSLDRAGLTTISFALSHIEQGHAYV